jgi:hypothetical protein
MSNHRMLPLLVLLAGCDSSSSTSSEVAKGDDKAAAAKPKKDDATLIAEGKAAAMKACSLPVDEFTDAKMQKAEALVGSVVHVWSHDAATPRERRQFVAKKAVVRALHGKEVEIYVTTDDADPCALPKSNDENLVSGPVVQSKAGNEVLVVRIADSAVGKYIGRSIAEAMADLMGGPKNFVGVVYTVKDAGFTPNKPDDGNTPWAVLNSEGRSYLEITALEPGKRLQADVHACLGAEEFLIGPIDASFCPDAPPKE